MSSTTYEEIFGEELVDATNAAQLADRAVAEAERLWASDAAGWRVLSDAPVRNESIPLRGAFAHAGVDLERGSATIDASAQLVFELLVSPEGTRLIDPYTDPKDRDIVLESFDASTWRPDGPAGTRLEVLRNIATIPLMAKREMIVLNMVDPAARHYACKSVLHAAAPGASAWGPADAQAQQPRSSVRALNTFAVRVRPVEGDASKCVVEMLNHVNLAGNFSAFMQRQFNKTFLPSVVGRLQKAVAQKQKQ